MNMIEQGSIVKLKSGGPKMTVLGLDDQDAICAWFCEAGNYHQKPIKLIGLTIYVVARRNNR
ncbi:YodC family protein [Aeromonas hydrophila]|uniref:YodC family protein n=1 Tax=Aeromonas hydrophila TaxID=644 RepID=UPI001CF0AAE2|nr:DUF2158 domain-containing protein [Aeromonas hydrophila]UCM63660.1 YodC family protein [Aeromonas hydrophila]